MASVGHDYNGEWHRGDKSFARKIRRNYKKHKREDKVRKVKRVSYFYNSREKIKLKK